MWQRIWVELQCLSSQHSHTDVEVMSDTTFFRPSTRTHSLVLSDTPCALNFNKSLVLKELLLISPLTTFTLQRLHSAIVWYAVITAVFVTGAAMFMLEVLYICLNRT